VSKIPPWRYQTLCMKPLLTIPIQTSDLNAIESLLKSSLKEVDALEIWIDFLKKADRTPERVEELVQTWKKKTSKKLVIVCKDKSERGKFTGKPKEKIELLLAASRGDAHYIDIGLQTGKSHILNLVEKNRKAKVIVSHHDFAKTPSWKRLQSLTKQIIELGADVVKIATMVHDPQDTEHLMHLALDLKKNRQKHIILGMGQLGITTRVFAKQLGNELNFVTLESKTAPGQLSLEQMLQFQSVLG